MGPVSSSRLCTSEIDLILAAKEKMKICCHEQAGAKGHCGHGTATRHGVSAAA